METNKPNNEEFFIDKREDPFKVPHNYFDDLTNRVMSNIEQQEHSKQELIPNSTISQSKRSVWSYVRPYVYMAAMFLCIMFSFKLFKSQVNTKAHQTTVAANEEKNITPSDSEVLFNALEEEMADKYWTETALYHQ